MGNKIETEADAAPKFFRLLVGYLAAVNVMDNDAAGEFLKGSLDYVARAGKSKQKFSCSAAKVAFEFIRPSLDADIKRFQDVTQKRIAAVNKRWSREAMSEKNSNLKGE